MTTCSISGWCWVRHQETGTVCEGYQTKHKGFPGQRHPIWQAQDNAQVGKHKWKKKNDRLKKQRWLLQVRRSTSESGLAWSHLHAQAVYISTHMSKPILGAQDTKTVKHNSQLPEAQGPISYRHASKLKSWKGREKKQTRISTKKLLEKPRLEECADSLMNWDHLLNVNPTWSKHDLNTCICKLRAGQYMVCRAPLTLPVLTES